MTEVHDSLIIDELLTNDGITGLSPIVLATTSPGNLAADFADGDVIDGETLVEGDRVLIKDQINPADNGVYVVQNSGAPVRAEDSLPGVNVQANTMWITKGTINQNTGWVGSGIIGTNATFTRYDASTTLEIKRGGTGSTSLDGIVIGNGTSALTAKKSEFNATTNPGSSNDLNDGYSIGSRWININSDNEYVCLDASVGSAVWKLCTGGSGGEINTVSNVGVGGIGIFKQKTGVNLEFKNINDKEGIVITDDVGKNEIDIGLNIISLDTDNSPDLSSDFVATYDVSAGRHKKVLLNNIGGGGGGAPTVYEVLTRSASTTTSTNFVDMPSMSFTPPAGKYLVMFSATYNLSQSTGGGTIVFFKDFTYLGDSQRVYDNGFSWIATERQTLHTQLQISVNGSEEIKVRYRSDSNSNAFNVFERSMQIMLIS